MYGIIIHAGGQTDNTERTLNAATAPARPAGRERTRTIAVTVQRSRPEDTREFAVEVADPVTVLDLLREIQRAHDPSLAFRFSCRVAMCGTCGVRVDGRSSLACRSIVEMGRDAVEIAPLAAFRVVRDLVVDTRPFWREWARVLPWFVPGADVDERVAPGSPEAALLDATLGCIGCGACYSSCEIAGHGSDYLGPAALNRALALIVDPRDGAAPARLDAVGGRGGVDRCHYVQACTSACPVGLDPAGSIVELRRLRLRSRG